MSTSVVMRLIAKDLYLYRWFALFGTLAGLAALPLMGANSANLANLGMIVFITTVIVAGVFIAMFGVLKERQDKSLLFVLSLPVSPVQAVAAKLAAALIGFIVPWLVLTLVPVALIAGSDATPDGRIVSFVALMAFFLANFCVLLALVAVSPNERWAIAGLIVTNIAASCFVVVLPQLPGIAEYRQEEVAVWSATALILIGTCLATAATAPLLALWALSRKRDWA